MCSLFARLCIAEDCDEVYPCHPVRDALAVLRAAGLAGVPEGDGVLRHSRE